MFLDASAIVAILNREPEADELVRRLEAARNDRPPLFSPLSRFEAIVSLARSRSGRHRSATAEQIDLAVEAVDLLLAETGAKSVMISDSIGAGAVKAARDYGRAVGHPAALNLGDCFAYACARGYRAALLYKGDGFSGTDLG
ncbi:MAG: VapC toxin family PIN domain ribonuclease [Rhodovulum sulfidophilum]|uniref:Ribonuclease VapC n=1 Tax=Rhodovulum sulfidophilum TaxID=35806 RepID=A0A2W5NDJ4_RHOSU|nr:MAG: VapC toxin family PIN domain ribonuclease [Rhodovulum sulfidophilum]